MNKPSCCLGCHFDYEEKHAFPCLPEWARRLLYIEHENLRARGFPWAEVEAHAEREMGLFRLYCPPDVVAFIDADHVHFTRNAEARY